MKNNELKTLRRGDLPDNETISIPNEIEKIEEKAFEGYTRIREVILPTSVISIGHAAFAHTPIEKISIPRNSRLSVIGTGAFYHCKHLQEIYIPAGVKEIRDSSFEGCEFLTSIRGGRNVIKIGVSAMHDCTSLSHLELGDRLKRVKDHGLMHTAVPEIIFPDGFEWIGWWGASSNRHLQFVSFPPDVSRGNYVFDQCGELYDKNGELFRTLVVEHREPNSEPARDGYAYRISGRVSDYPDYWVFGGSTQEAAKARALADTSGLYTNEVFHLEVAPVENRRLIVDSRRIATDTTHDNKDCAVWRTI